jgi:hypothetical protein
VVAAGLAGRAAFVVTLDRHLLGLTGLQAAESCGRSTSCESCGRRTDRRDQGDGDESFNPPTRPITGNAVTRVYWFS